MKRIAKGVLSLDLFSKFHPEAQERTISGTIGLNEIQKISRRILLIFFNFFSYLY